MTIIELVRSMILSDWKNFLNYFFWLLTKVGRDSFETASHAEMCLWEA